MRVRTCIYNMRYILPRRCFSVLVIFVATFAVAKQLHLWLSLPYLEHFKRTEDCAYPESNFFLLSIPQSETVVTSIVQRFALRHALPIASASVDGGGEQKPNGLPPYHTAVGEQNHILYKTTKYITILRHPFDHLQSVINERRRHYSNLRLQDYVKSPQKYEERWGQNMSPISLTNNPFSRALGLNMTDFRNSSMVSVIVNRTEEDFSSVLILEKLDESLVMLRRLMCWSFADILYNIQENKESDIQLGISRPNYLIKKHSQWAVADYQLYKHFSDKLKDYMTKEGIGFDLEVAEFKKTMLAVDGFCNHVLNEGEFIEVGTIEWGGVYKFFGNDCSLLLSSSYSLRNYLDRNRLTLHSKD